MCVLPSPMDPLYTDTTVHATKKQLLSHWISRNLIQDAVEFLCSISLTQLFMVQTSVSATELTEPLCWCNALWGHPSAVFRLPAEHAGERNVFLILLHHPPQTKFTF